MEKRKFLQIVFIISLLPICLEWFGAHNIMSYSGWMALGSGCGAYLYLAGIIVFEFLLWKMKWVKAAGISNWRNKSGIFLCDDVMGISGCNCSSDGSMGGTYNCGFKGLGGVM